MGRQFSSDRQAERRRGLSSIFRRLPARAGLVIRSAASGPCLFMGQKWVAGSFFGPAFVCPRHDPKRRTCHVERFVNRADLSLSRWAGMRTLMFYAGLLADFSDCDYPAIVSAPSTSWIIRTIRRVFR